MKKQSFIIIFEQEKDGGFCVSAPSLPGCFSQGNTFEEAMKNIQSAVKLYIKDTEPCFYQSKEKEFAVPLEIGVV